MRCRLRLLTLLAVSSIGACAPEGPTAFVTFNVKPDEDCTYSKDSADGNAIPTGRYDILRSGSASAKSEGCVRPYFVHLLVNSFLRANSDATLGRAEPNILQLDRAEVRLMDIQKRTIIFGDGQDTPLFNPFLVTTNNSLQPSSNGKAATTGIATIEAIPVAYAEFLDDPMFENQQILAEVQIFGTTTGDVDIDLKPFIYPIEICRGCLNRCLSSLTAMGKNPDELTSGACVDMAGADGRYCIDDGC
jgi:hypothetical protein